ncbi:MAG: hypothetical protein ACRD0A_16940 [Acidimicrobiales bacterium]
MSTWLFEHQRLRPGRATIRLSGPVAGSSSGEYGVWLQAFGLAAAARLNRLHHPATTRSCSAGVRPARARSALSIKG